MLRRIPGILTCVGLIVALGAPVSAQDAHSFANRMLRWPDPVRGDDDDAIEPVEDIIETDRNSLTFSPYTAGSRRVVVESAYSYLQLGKRAFKHSFPETLVRYGVGDRLELRLGYNFETGRQAEEAEGDIAANFGINAQQQIFYGFKYALTRQTPSLRFRPNTAVLTQVHTPVGSIEGHTQIRLGYVWGWVLANGWTFEQGIRFGTDRERDDGYTLWAPATVLRIPLGREKRWFTHVEYFGVMSQAKQRDFSKQFIDTGLHYFITPNIEVGTIVAFGINEQSRGIVVNAGIGVRF